MEEMVLVLLDAGDLLRLEEEVVGHHFVDSAGEGEDIGIGEVVVADEDLGRAVFPRLYILGEVLVGKAGVA